MTDLKVIDGKGDRAKLLELEPDIYDLDRAARLAECALDDDELHRFAAEQLCERVQELKAKYCKLMGD
jgi:hypothetical protein